MNADWFFLHPRVWCVHGLAIVGPQTKVGVRLLPPLPDEFALALLQHTQTLRWSIYGHPTPSPLMVCCIGHAPRMLSLFLGRIHFHVRRHSFIFFHTWSWAFSGCLRDRHHRISQQIRHHLPIGAHSTPTWSLRFLGLCFRLFQPRGSFIAFCEDKYATQPLFFSPFVFGSRETNLWRSAPCRTGPRVAERKRRYRNAQSLKELGDLTERKGQ